MAKVWVIGNHFMMTELAGQMIHYPQLCQDIHTVTNVYDKQSHPNGGATTSLTIHTKYYRALLDLHLIGRDVYHDWSHENMSEFAGSCEGIIMTIAKDEEFDPTNIDAKIGKIFAENNCALRLIAYYQSSTGEIPPAMFEWSLDHGFECIALNGDNIVEGWQLREKEGLPRLMEALQSNMWSTMSKIAATSAATVSKSTGSAGVGDATSSPAEASASEPDIVSVEVSAEASRAAVAVTVATEDTRSASTSTEASEKLVADSILEKDVESFVELLSKARSLRDDVQQGNMTDEARRERAAEMALRLCAMLNIDDDSDEEDDM